MGVVDLQVSLIFLHWFLMTNGVSHMLMHSICVVLLPSVSECVCLRAMLSQPVTEAIF